MRALIFAEVCLLLFSTCENLYSQELERKEYLNENTDNFRFENASKTYVIKNLMSNNPSKTHHNSDTIPESEGVIAQDGYIEQMSNYLALRISFVNDNERFSLDAGPTVTDIYPNGSSKIKLNLNYRFLSVNFNFIPKFISSNDDDQLKGKTTGMGLGFDFNFSHWVQSISYSRTTGYYLDNTSDFDQDWQEGDPYIQFPYLHYRSFQGVTGYNFNPHFSTKALVSGTERQLKSAGTFLPTLLYRYYIVDNRDEVTPDLSTQKSNNFEIIANAGYYYTYVLNEQFYASAGASAGYGLLSSKVITRFFDDRVEAKQNNGVFKWDGRAALGYNGERFFSGIFLTAENRRFKQQNTSVINANWRVFMQVHVGYRLFAPKFLREKVDALPFGS